MATAEFTLVHNDDLAALRELIVKLALLNEMCEHQISEIEKTLLSIKQKNNTDEILYSTS
jgi:hypothetical protein